VNSKTVVRGGYGISYSSPVYQSMAQRMSAQPPFATTDTRLGELGVPLMLTTAFATPTPPSVTTNNFAVARQYALGWLQMWNVDLQRDLTRRSARAWVRRRAGEPRLQRAEPAPTAWLSAVQPFLWEEWGHGSCRLSVRLQKRPAACAGFSTLEVARQRVHAGRGQRHRGPG
jgi:hypothetical protein